MARLSVSLSQTTLMLPGVCTAICGMSRKQRSWTRRGLLARRR
jgi:hypothetical protein